MDWKWRQVETKADAELYAKTLLKNQPQYHTDGPSVLAQATDPNHDYTYQIGEELLRGERICFRVILASDPPILNQYGASGPNWATAFARGIKPVCDRMNELAPTLSKLIGRPVIPYDLGEVWTEIGGKRMTLLDECLAKLTTGPTVLVNQARGNEGTRRRYRMVASGD